MRIKVLTAFFILCVSFYYLLFGRLSYAEYTIGPEDVLSISVSSNGKEEKKFSGKFEVRKDGTINYSYVGKIKVADFTEKEIEEKLKSILSKDYFVDPEVDVSVAEYKSKSVIVMGAVKRPGIYNLRDKSDLLTILSLAGGVRGEGGSQILVLRKVKPHKSVVAGKSDKKEKVDSKVAVEAGSVETASKGKVAHGEESTNKTAGHAVGKTNKKGAVSKKEDAAAVAEVVLKDKAGRTDKTNMPKTLKKALSSPAEVVKPIIIDMDKLFSKGDLKQNINLKDGDIINVQEPNEVFVYGSVQKPGRIPYRKGMTIRDAVSLAGGTTDTASKKGTYVLRKGPDGSDQKIKVRLDKVLDGKIKPLELKPNDFIMVPESFF